MNATIRSAVLMCAAAVTGCGGGEATAPPIADIAIAGTYHIRTVYGRPVADPFLGAATVLNSLCVGVIGQYSEVMILNQTVTMTPPPDSAVFSTSVTENIA